MSDYTVMRAADAPDYTGDAPGAFIGYGRPMGSEQLGFNVRVLEPGMTHAPPGSDPTWGHGHHTIEEIYFVLDGEVTIKLGDDVTTLGPRDAVLIPPQTVRSVRNESGELASFLMCSVRVEDPRAESRPLEGFWPEAG
jgi:mannose-6-phosphate isomerase-like protein (cupin superfamily)